MMPALAGIDAATVRFPGVTQIAAFDTSFHANLPDAAAQFAIPFEWSERWGLRRFGFLSPING
jgi:acetate kinase